MVPSEERALITAVALLQEGLVEAEQLPGMHMPSVGPTPPLAITAPAEGDTSWRVERPMAGVERRTWMTPLLRPVPTVAGGYLQLLPLWSMAQAAGPSMAVAMAAAAAAGEGADALGMLPIEVK